MADTVSYWLPPNEEILPSTGCSASGRVATFHQLPKREWICPNEYPTLKTHPVYGMHQWWNPMGLSGSPAAHYLGFTPSVASASETLRSQGQSLLNVARAVVNLPPVETPSSVDTSRGSLAFHDQITAMIRAQDPGIGTSGRVGVGLLVAGTVVGLSGLTYWLVKKYSKKKNPPADLAVYHAMGESPMTTGEIYSKVHKRHPEMSSADVIRALESLARDRHVLQASRSGMTGVWKKV